MDSLSSKLLTANIIGVLTWMENTQNLFGMMGAVVGCFSAVMLVCINWEKFAASKPLKWLMAKFNRGEK